MWQCSAVPVFAAQRACDRTYPSQLRGKPLLRESRGLTGQPDLDLGDALVERRLDHLVADRERIGHRFVPDDFRAANE